MYSVSQSKVKTYKMCQLAYHYKYVEKLRKKKKSRPLKFGTIVHEMLEAKAKKKDPFEKLDELHEAEKNLFLEEREEYGNIIDDIRFIMTDYFKFYKKDGLITVKKKGIAAEHEFEIEIADGILLNGKIDQVCKTEDGLRWLTEHKTFGKKPPHPDHLWRNLQSSIYMRVLQMLGWKEVDGVLWNYIHSKPPGQLQINKDGSISKRKIVTLPSRLKYDLIQAGEKPSKYKVLMANAKASRERYFQRFYTPVQDSVVDTIFGDFVDTAIEMSENHGKAKTRTFGQHCEWCDFEPLCRAELNGTDTEFLKERNYDVNKKEKKQKREKDKSKFRKSTNKKAKRNK